MKLHSMALTLMLGLAPVAANAEVAAPLHRTYQDGQTLKYHMTGDNNGWTYAIDATAAAKKDAGGAWYEDITWSNMISNGQMVPPSPAMAAYRQQLSLDPSHFPSPPDLRQVDPKMVGPITDLMTFYVDLWLAGKFNTLTKPGDHFYFPNPMAPSWADGARVITGEDSIDFDMTLKSVSPVDSHGDNTAVLEVRHVPPPQSKVHLAAEWMQKPVDGTPNNWVEVQKRPDGSYLASVGKETFDVDITVSLTDGRILHAEMVNPVKHIERICADAALSQCSEAKASEILRKIEIKLVP